MLNLVKNMLMANQIDLKSLIRELKKNEETIAYVHNQDNIRNLDPGMKFKALRDLNRLYQKVTGWDSGDRFIHPLRFAVLGGEATDKQPSTIYTEKSSIKRARPWNMFASAPLDKYSAIFCDVPLVQEEAFRLIMPTKDERLQEVEIKERELEIRHGGLGNLLRYGTRPDYKSWYDTDEHILTRLVLDLAALEVKAHQEETFDELRRYKIIAFPFETGNSRLMSTRFYLVGNGDYKDQLFVYDFLVDEINGEVANFSFNPDRIKLLSEIKGEPLLARKLGPLLNLETETSALRIATLLTNGHFDRYHFRTILHEPGERLDLSAYNQHAERIIPVPDPNVVHNPGPTGDALLWTSGF
jgi:hypothetical protein